MNNEAYKHFIEQWDLDPSEDHTEHFEAWNQHWDELEEQMFLEEQRLFSNLN